jgi:VCBS repeat protein
MMKHLALIAGLGAAALVAPNALASVASDVPPTTVWDMHTIVGGTPGSTGFNGSDGVDLADINHDGDRDVVSGYEQGHRVTVSLHPKVPTQPWQKVTLPGSGNQLLGPEDAVFADVDDDGALDVIVACEAGTKVTVYFAPIDDGGADYDAVLMNPANWTKVRSGGVRGPELPHDAGPAGGPGWCRRQGHPCRWQGRVVDRCRPRLLHLGHPAKRWIVDLPSDHDRRLDPTDAGDRHE